MDFIERILGSSPDGGLGGFELLLFALPIAALAYLWHRRHKRIKPMYAVAERKPSASFGLNFVRGVGY
jgi:hypothetical protein